MKVKREVIITVLIFATLFLRAYKGSNMVYTRSLAFLFIGSAITAPFISTPLLALYPLSLLFQFLLLMRISM